MATGVRLCGVPRRSFGYFPIAGKVTRPAGRNSPAALRRRNFLRKTTEAARPGGRVLQSRTKIPCPQGRKTSVCTAGAGETFPRPYLRVCLICVLLPYLHRMMAVCPKLSGSGGRGPWRGGGPAPCGHCGWPYACGSRAPWNAGASWADRYEAWGTPPHLISSRRTGPTTAVSGCGSQILPGKRVE